VISLLAYIEHLRNISRDIRTIIQVDMRVPKIKAQIKLYNQKSSSKTNYKFYSGTRI
jgi:hypothetical protein